MTTTEIRAWLLLSAVLMMFGALVCWILTVRWRLRRGLSWRPGLERDLTQWGSPDPKLLRDAVRAIRSEARARSPECAALVRRLARRDLESSLAPWSPAKWTLLILAQVVNMAQTMFVLTRGLGLVLSLTGFAALSVGVLVGSPLYWRRARKRSERALELNEGLAEQTRGGTGP